MRKKVWLMGILLTAAVLSPSWTSALEQEVEHSLYRMAGLQDLVQYPDVVPDSERPLGQELFLTILPSTNLAVILRPISEGEYGAFQVQAIGYDIIERQMLAAAFVLPVITEGDVAALAPELIAFLKQQVNAISGFEIFDVTGLPLTPPAQGDVVDWVKEADAPK